MRDFTRRRLLRIVPAYWLALTVLSIKPGLADVFTHDWWRYYGFLQIYDPVTRLSGLTVAWTLCIEVTFYLALPVYAAFARRAFSGLERSGRIRAELALLTGLARPPTQRCSATLTGSLSGWDSLCSASRCAAGSTRPDRCVSSPRGRP